MPSVPLEFAPMSAARHVPARHRSDPQGAMEMAAHLTFFLPPGQPKMPAASHLDELGSWMWRGDPLADDVASWMIEVGVSQGRATLEQALNQAPEHWHTLPVPLRRYLSHCTQTPTWLRPELLTQGARMIQSTGLHGMMVLRDVGLMAGYQASAINRTLLATGALQKGPQRRVAETSSWWVDCTREQGLQVQAAGFKSTLGVRVMHALVRHHVAQRPQWDAAQWGLPINQLDMQATYLGFSVAYLIGLRVTGVPVSAHQAQAVMHLWRYVGWLMGVDESLLFETEMQGRVGLYDNLLCQSPADDSSVALARALMDEPLHRHYRSLPKLRGRLNRARHLSLARLFVGRAGMQRLGLPTSLPWYPLLSFLPRLGWHGLHTLTPALQDRLVERGGRQQVSYLRVLFGQHAPTLAAMPNSASGSHPAH